MRKRRVSLYSDVYASLFRVVCLIHQSIILSMSKYEGRVDPIELLRAAFTEHKLIKYKDHQLHFEKGVKLALTHPTAWVATHSRKHYNLGSLWLYIEYTLKRGFDYIEKVTHYGMEAVTISDRQEIEDYFFGRAHSTNCIDQQLRSQLSSKPGKTSIGFEGAQEPSKKKIEALSSELAVIDFISKFERPISSKSRSLRCPNKSLESLLKVFQSNNSSTEKDKNSRLRQISLNKKIPIIIVPEQQVAGNIGLANIEKFLVAGEYLPSPPPVPQHQRKCEITLTINSRKILFEVSNNPKFMSPNDWSAVVAIFLQGSKNEFEGWPCSDPNSIFKQAKVFLLKFPGKQTPSLEASVKELTLDRNLRYRDSLVQKEILADIEEVLNQPI